ncbi:MAG: hypothetical protein U0136_07460 [Bdellovibrionota bacterium]
MGMTFSNAAVKFEVRDEIIKIARSVPPIEEDGDNFAFESFYLFPPVSGWTSILAPGDHPANSYSLASAVAAQKGVLGFAGFVSQSSKIGVRFFNGDEIFSFMNYAGEYQGGGDLDKLVELFQPTVPDGYTSLVELFSTDKLMGEELYAQIIAAFGLPPLLCDYGYEYVERAEEEDDIDEIFGKDLLPQIVLMEE